METCERCGHPLGAERECPGCGHRGVDRGPTDTAERPAVVDPSAPTAGVGVTPPPVLQAPPQPRFPLYADEVGRGPMPSGPPPSSPPPSSPPSSSPSNPPSGHRAGHGRPGWLPWAIGAGALVLVAALGVVLLVTGGDDDPSAQDSTPTTAASPTPTPTQTPTPMPTPAKPKKPKKPENPEKPQKPENVAARATAKVPRTAPPNTDVQGNLVRFEARHLLDGVPSTCWRMPGDGTGSSITVTLDGPTTLTRVGMINGYAKSSEDGGRTLDWYRGNRRVLAAEWTFDDGTTVSQTLGQTRRLQTVDLDGVTTSTVTLRLVEVSAPGSGPSARNYTAISDLAFVGTPAP